jgi:hypothetical protein
MPSDTTVAKYARASLREEGGRDHLLCLRHPFPGAVAVLALVVARRRPYTVGAGGLY